MKKNTSICFKPIPIQSQADLDEKLSLLKQRPKDVQLSLETAVLALDSGQPQVAVNLMHRLSRQQPRLGIAHFTLGRALSAMDDWHGASDALTTALSLDPSNGGCCARLAEALLRIGSEEEAHLLARQAMALPVLAVESFILLGDVFKEVGDLEFADCALHKALELRDDGRVHHKLGRLFWSMKKFSQSTFHHRRAVDLSPEDALCLAGLGDALISIGDAESGLRLMEKAYSLDPGNKDVASVVAFAGNTDPDNNPEQYHRQCAEMMGRLFPSCPPAFSPRHDRNPERKLRIGYLSPDFRTHAMMHWVAPLLEARHSDEFEVMCFAEGGTEDRVTEHFRSLADRWFTTTGKSAAEAARKIASLGVDILVDLAGATAGNRLDIFALKPAPVQVAMLGFDRSTCLQAMDWRISTALADPPGEVDRWSVDRVWRLETSFCYAPPTEAPEVAAAPVLKNGFITFGFLGNPARVGRVFMEAAADLLKAIPESRLQLLCREGEDEAHQSFKRGFLSRAGVDPDRVDFRPRVLPESRFLEYYSDIDITLNSFPADGGTTICESLWMGVPVLVLDRAEALRHTGRALLTYAGMSDWVATGIEDWVGLARGWNENPQALANLRRDLRGKMLHSCVCDAPRAVRAIEDAYRGMWRAWCGKT